MADNKQYVTQQQDNGSIKISEDVVETIVAQAITEVEGIVGLSVRPGADFVDLLGVNWGKGIKVNVNADNTLEIDCNVLIRYGQNVVSVAAAAQQAILATVESMTGVKVASVNVNVCDIVR